jgi:hypothetical protein
MTLDEAVNRYEPVSHIALIEPWVSGGTVQGGLVVTHSTDLPIVYGFIHRLPVGYSGPITPGDLVVYPRYAYEVFASGRDLDDAGNFIPWELAVIDIDVIEAIVDLKAILL